MVPRLEKFGLERAMFEVMAVEEDHLDLRVAWGTFYVHYLVVNVQIQMV